jgi:hypothetical protein
VCEVQCDVVRQRDTHPRSGTPVIHAPELIVMMKQVVTRRERNIDAIVTPLPRREPADKQTVSSDATFRLDSIQC